MEHMKHLGIVAASDIEVLRHKERTYQGSWKKAGGRSAWFMFRRNMDRLIGILSPPEKESWFDATELKNNIMSGFDGQSQTCHLDFETVLYLVNSMSAEDIFKKIEEAPGGEDGTALACLRDLRRYAMLIEAEMVARGVVQPEQAPGTPEDGGHHESSNDPWTKTMEGSGT